MKAMATYGEIMSQARQLHLSGDTEGARRLIAQARQMGTQQPGRAPSATDRSQDPHGLNGEPLLGSQTPERQEAVARQAEQHMAPQRPQEGPWTQYQAPQGGLRTFEVEGPGGQRMEVQAADEQSAVGAVKAMTPEQLAAIAAARKRRQDQARSTDATGATTYTVEQYRAAARRALEAGDVAAAERLAAAGRRAEGARPTGGVPEGMFLNPETGQMTSREMLRNNVQPSQPRAAIGGAMQGVGLQFGDEALGALGYLEGGSDMATFRREQARATLEADAAAHPKTALGAEIGGAVTTGLATAPLAAASTLPRVAARGAALGTAEGAIHGIGRGEGAGRLQTGKEDATLGALLGGLTPFGLAAGRAAGRAVFNPVAGAIDGALNRPSQRRANRALGTAVQRSGRSLEDLADDVARAGADGQPEFVLADALGSPGQRMLSGVARQPGDYRGELADYLNQRQAQQGRRIAGFVAEGLDAPDTAKARTAALTQGRNAAADAAFDAARGNAAPVDVRGALEVIQRRIGGMEGSGITGDGIDARLARYRNRLSANDPSRSQTGTTGVAGQGAGPASSVELSDFDRVLGVKQDISDDIGAAVRAGRSNEARELTKLRDALDAALEEASPSYRAANDEFRNASRVIDAVEDGRAMRRPSARVADNLDRYRTMTPEQQAAARAGYADPLMSRIENAAPGVDKSRALMDDGTSDELAAMARDPELMAHRIGRESTMFDTRQRALGGSQTADNLSDIEDANAIGGSLASVLAQGANFQFGNAVQTLGRLIGPAMKGDNEATRELIAKALLSRDPQAALAPALRQAMRSEGQQRVIEALTRSGGLRLAD